MRLIWHFFFLRLLQGHLIIIKKWRQVREVDQNGQGVNLCRLLTCLCPKYRHINSLTFVRILDFPYSVLKDILGFYLLSVDGY